MQYNKSKLWFWKVISGQSENKKISYMKRLKHTYSNHIFTQILFRLYIHSNHIFIQVVYSFKSLSIRVHDRTESPVLTEIVFWIFKNVHWLHIKKTKNDYIVLKILIHTGLELEYGSSSPEQLCADHWYRCC